MVKLKLSVRLSAAVRQSWFNPRFSRWFAFVFFLFVKYRLSRLFQRLYNINTPGRYRIPERGEYLFVSAFRRIPR